MRFMFFCTHSAYTMKTFPTLWYIPQIYFFIRTVWDFLSKTGVSAGVSGISHSFRCSSHTMTAWMKTISLQGHPGPISGIPRDSSVKQCPMSSWQPLSTKVTDWIFTRRIRKLSETVWHIMRCTMFTDSVKSFPPDRCIRAILWKGTRSESHSVTAMGWSSKAISGRVFISEEITEYFILLTKLKLKELDDLIESIGLPECKLCTYCFNGKE